MSREIDIFLEIHRLEQKINEHEGFYEELKEGYQKIRNLYFLIKEKAADPEANYDMTKGDLFMGQLEQEAEELQRNIVEMTTDALDDTNKHLLELQRAMKQIHDFIEGWHGEINSLEAELASIHINDAQKGL